MKRPQVYLEEPSRLPVPIVISHYKPKKPVTVNRATGRRRWPFTRKRDAKTKGTTICRWFRKRRALKELRAEHERDRKRLEWDPAFREEKAKEYEYFQQLYKQQADQYQQKEERRIVDSYSYEKPKKQKKEKVVKPKKEKVVKPKKEKVVKPKKEKVAKVKKVKYVQPSTQTKFIAARPQATSRCVYVKTYNRHLSFNERFVNCFYRFCCQLYCCFTILALIGVAIVVLV